MAKAPKTRMWDKQKFQKISKQVSKKGRIKAVNPSKDPLKHGAKQTIVKKAAAKTLITKDTPLGDIIHKYPAAGMIMMKYGLHCIGCHVATYETIEQGCKGHGMSDEQIKQMVAEMNELIKKQK